MSARTATPYRTEERFVELFQDVFGPAAAAKLVPQYGYEDIEGRSRFIDFALESLLDRYAIEIDGETYHHPAVLAHGDYADQLVRQNSLIHAGWRVLRWSDWQIGKDPERVREHLSVLLDAPVRLVIPQEHLPCKRGALVELFEHQREALASLDALRREGNEIALLSHAVGAGKTTTAVEDARRMGLRSLFLAHTIELVDQAIARFAELWPEATRARLGDGGDERAQVIVGTIQAMHGQLNRFDARHFGYIVIDEAHHATARTYQAVVRYFDPQFLLGLTGTEDRADGLSALEVFREAAHRMDLETAVRQGVLCDVRCFRVETNVDLRNLRFNGTVYRQADLEQRVTVPERNALIVDTYCRNVHGRSAVTFCVSLAHAEEMARRFREAGVPAAAVSGQLAKDDRRRVLDSYDRGKLQVLCACDVLNEGWDAPRTEVLLMGRPTLSKVLYQQQLGRGMRRHAGKDYLVVFDFVDVFSRHNRALSLHRLLRKARYRAGARVFQDEDGALPQELRLHLWATDYQLVDIFDWQERVEGMVTAPALSRMLRKSEGWVLDRWLRGELPADEVVELGRRSRVPYFAADRVAEIRAKYGLAEVTDETLYDDFVRFLAAMDMTHSYKPVWFLALLECVDDHGRARVSDVADRFHRFYLTRLACGLEAERGMSRLREPAGLTRSEVQQVINVGPFNRFSRMDFVGYARDRAFYEVNCTVWARLRDRDEREACEERCRAAIEQYFATLKRDAAGEDELSLEESVTDQ
ncbi:MAG: DEAD/DEAH box helicase family protein [Armatimonadetes bacterium]|nr:DEAD/DEAH box helicase family protein [Armatimonadota bacterium]MDE2205827.1 DEAD/DEAH box helicase family protein [Armatimonadota bacterium]